MAMDDRPTIGIGILSWKAHETLRASLDSYPPEFLDAFNQRLIYFSDISDDDIAIADRYGWDHTGGSNAGIAAGMKALSENLTTDYILLLQNDNPICEDTKFAINHIQKAVDLIYTGKADLARMRHRWQVGEGFADVRKYLKYYDVQDIANGYDAAEHNHPSTTPAPWKKQLQRLMKPYNAKRFRGRGVFIEQNPEQIFPDVIEKIDDFYVIDSSAIDFTDQCLLISRDLWLNSFVPYIQAHPSSTRSSNGFQAPELCINGPWWRCAGFKILQGQGIFTHARFDGSFRTKHWTRQDDKRVGWQESKKNFWIADICLAKPTMT